MEHYQMAEPYEMTLRDYMEVMRRRKWSIMITAVVIFVTAAVVAFCLPPVYKSTATILIEEQEIPVNFVTATVSSYAEERLHTINQRIMSTTRLMEIINQFKLYQDLRDKRTTDEIVGLMREDIAMMPISADVVDPRTGRPSAATIAFSLSYEGKAGPQKVQQVANVLTSLFLEENIKVRQRQTRETTEFLNIEMQKVKANLNELESQVAVYKERHINELPELLSVNMQALNNIERNIDRLDEQLYSLKEREGYLQTQLSNVQPMLRNSDKDRLEELKIHLVNLKTRFSDEYPDVVKVREEIAELERALAARHRPGSGSGELPDNPAYITLASQLSSTQADITSVKRLKQDLQRKLNIYQERIEATPQVEQEYQALITSRDNTMAKFNDLMAKFMEARVAQGLEKEQKGERFTLIDPPRLPEKPFKPNRLAIVLIGLVFGIGAGFGFAAFREFTDQTVLKAENLVNATSIPVLVAIPEIETREDRIRRNLFRAGYALLLVMGLTGGVAAFHWYVMDLNLFWIKVVARVGYLMQ